MTQNVAKLGLRHRAMQLERALIGEDRRVSFPASSESLVRTFSFDIGEYLEKLDHSPSSIRLDRLLNGGPLLKDHDRRAQIGVIEGAEVRDRRLEVTARFGNSQTAAEEAADVADGIRRSVSIGYIVHELRLEEKREEGLDVYVATSWEPVEVSVVSIPADPTVGFGRSEGDVAFRDHETRVIRRDVRQEGNGMDWITVIRREDGVLLRIRESAFDEKLYERHTAANAAQPPAAAPASSNAPTPGITPGATRGAEGVDVAAIQRDERTRTQEILALGSRFNLSDKALEAVRDGVSLAAFRDYVWSKQEPWKPLDAPKTHLGMGKREIEGFSIVRAMRAIADGRRSDAAFEFECSDAIGQALGKPARGLYVPADVLYERVDPDALKLRDITKGTSGANLVATNLQPQSFIELLRNATKVVSMGARMLPGLVGDVAIPRHATGAVAAWVGEGGTTSESDATFDQVTLNPKTITVRTDMTRRMLMQSSPAIEGLVRADLSNALAQGIDSAAIRGSGAANQPRGILNVVGVGLVSLGVNGAVATWASQVDLVKTAMVANADVGTLGFLTNANVWASLMKTDKATAFGEMILREPGNSLLGRRFEVSQQVPSNLVKGTSGAVASAEIYGNWGELLIGEWGVLDLFPDPYTLGDSGGLVIRAFKDIDVAVRHAQSFAIIVDMLTP